MAKLGDLTLSGELYEGNFDDWEPRMLAILRRRDFDISVGSNGYVVLDAYAYEGSREGDEAIQLVRAMTSTAMLKRIPHRDSTDCQRLLDQLKAHAKPFRFLDLPAEIRNEIYTMLFPQNHWVFDCSCSWEIREEVSNLPAITQSNHQIRSEALPLLYCTTAFHLAKDVYADRTQVVQPDFDWAKEWFESIAGEHKRHLRRVSFHAWIDVIVEFTYSEGAGIAVNVKKNNGTRRSIGQTPGSDQVVKSITDHTKTIEHARQVLGIKGESLVLAILTNPLLWKDTYKTEDGR